jgi:hypothetical protein
MGTVAIANNIPGDMLCEKADNSVVFLMFLNPCILVLF